MKFILNKIFEAFLNCLKTLAKLKNNNHDSLSQQVQKVLINQYQLNALQGLQSCANLSEAGFRCYSQFEEDGIILYILAMVKMKTRIVVEIGCGLGLECMATNLIVNHGYNAYLFDSSRFNIQLAKAFFHTKKECHINMPYLKDAWVTKENVNDLLKDAGVTGEVDLLSIDIDGNDYHIWEAITVIQPRVCVFETHNVIPSDLSLTIPYDPNFASNGKSKGKKDFCSVSLLAMKKLSEAKGYRMIGAHRYGFNVFFLRNDIGVDMFPEVSVDDVHQNTWTMQSQRDRWPLVKDMAWEAV